MQRVVVACVGDEQSTETIQQLASSSEVIAVALDFGGAVPLTAMREYALSAGAVRCHALDVREEFARDCVLPALRARAFADPAVAFGALAPAFVARKLADIAQVENAVVITPDPVNVSTRPVPSAATAPLHLEIAFRDGLPVSINGVEMTLTELMESIETITGEPALYVLDREMQRSREPELA